MTKETFGEFLKRKRHELNLTQAKMAETVDLSLRFLQELESEESIPGLESIKKIVRGLNIDPAEIFGMPSRAEPSPPTTRALLNALNEMEKELKTLKSGLPNELISAWQNADDTARKMALQALDMESEARPKRKDITRK